MHILKEGDKVGASEATLLNMLNISPFSYGLAVQMVYDSGTIFEPSILDIKPEDLLKTFLGVSFILIPITTQHKILILIIHNVLILCFLYIYLKLRFIKKNVC